MAKAKTKQQLTVENEELRARLQELEDTLEAIRSGAVDAIVTSGPAGDRVYTLEGADHAYHTMVESMNEGAVTVLADGTILYANRQFGQMTGASPSAIVGRPFHDFVQASDHPIWDGFIRQAGSDGLKAEVRFGNQSAAEIPVQISATPIDLGGSKALALVVTDLTESRRYEEIVTAERLSRYILEQSLEGVAVCINGRIIFASRRLHEIYGGNPLMQPFDKLFPLRMSEREVFSVEITQSGQVVKSAEVSYQNPEGESYSLILNAGPLYGDEHRILGCLVSLTDITERKRGEEEIARLNRELEHRLQELEAVFHTAPIGLAITEDPEARHIRGNPANEQMLGVLRGAELSKRPDSGPAPYRILQDGRELTVDELPMQRAARGESVSGQIMAVVREDGSTIRLFSNASPLLDEQGRPRGAVGAFLDITELSRAQDALRESEQQYRSLFDSMTEGFAIHEIVTDAGGRPVDYRFLAVNASFERLTGLKRQDVIGRLMTECLPGDDPEWIALYGKVALTGEPLQLEKYSPALERWYEVFAYRTAPRQFAVIFMDVTDRKQAEEDLRRSEARFRLLSGIAGRLLATDDPQGLVQELCRDVMEYLDCQAFFNFMADERAGRLRLNACAGIPEEEVRKLEWLDYGVAVCGCVARDGARIIAEDIFHTPDARTERVKSYGIQAYCCHPLKAQERFIGTLSFGTKTRSRFTPEEIELMRIVADQVAVAMQRIQAQQEIGASEEALRLANEHLEQRVRERTMDLQNLAKQLELSRGELRKLASELVMAEERERKRIAGVLHDEIAQTLAAARMRADMIRGIPSDQEERMKETKALLAQSIRETRSLMNDLGTPLLFDMGLQAACESLADRLMRIHPVRIRCDIGDAYKRLDPDVKIILYQLIRELLNNIVKHSQAQNALVAIDTENGMFRVKVTDDGVGFDPEVLGAPTAEGGFGLYSIRERLIAIDGTLRIESAPGAGTTVTAIVPSKMD